MTPNYQTSCQNRTPCDTIDGYYQKNSSIFSTSDVTWFFLEGEHFIAERDIAIKRAQNVKIKGDHYLKSTSIYFAQIHSPLEINFSKNITIEYLKIYTFGDDYRLTTEFQHVHNLIIKNVKWFTASAADFICLVTGTINIQETTFSGEFMIKFIFEEFNRRIKSKFLSINIQQTDFWNTRGIELDHHRTRKTYDSVEISIDRCCFYGYWPMFFMQINQFGLAN